MSEERSLPAVSAANSGPAVGVVASRPVAVPPPLIPGPTAEVNSARVADASMLSQTAAKSRVEAWTRRARTAVVWAWNETKLVATASYRQSLRFIGFAADERTRHLLRRQLEAAMADLGTRLFELKEGEPALHLKIEEADRRLAAPNAAGSSVPQSRATRRSLLIELATAGLSARDPSSGTEAQRRAVLSARAALQQHEKDAMNRRSNLFPSDLATRIRVLVGYSAAVVLFSSFLNSAQRPSYQTAWDRYRQQTESMERDAERRNVASHPMEEEQREQKEAEGGNNIASHPVKEEQREQKEKEAPVVNRWRHEQQPPWVQKSRPTRYRTYRGPAYASPDYRQYYQERAVAEAQQAADRATRNYMNQTAGSLGAMGLMWTPGGSGASGYGRTYGPSPSAGLPPVRRGGNMP
jgi:hypothetical protein